MKPQTAKSGKQIRRKDKIYILLVILTTLLILTQLPTLVDGQLSQALAQIKPQMPTPTPTLSPPINLDLADYPPINNLWLQTNKQAKPPSPTNYPSLNSR